MCYIVLCNNVGLLTKTQSMQCFISPAAIEESLPGSFYGRASYTLEDILAELEISNSSSRMEEIMDPGKKR